MLLVFGASAVVTGFATLAESYSPSASSSSLVAQGYDLYNQSCAQCHGPDATGYNGPTLHNIPLSDARISATIKTGIKDHMPAFDRKYDDRQIEALTSYLRILR